MENVTLGQIAAIISLVGIFIGAITSLIAFYKSQIKKILNPLDKKIDHIGEISMQSRNNIELELIKMILVNFINDIELGVTKTQIQKQNAYELYDRYVLLGGNSYVHDKWEELIREKKI